MLRGTLLFGSVIVAVLELAGFVALQDYLDNFHVPIQYSPLAVVEFMRWGVYVFSSELPPIIGWIVAAVLVLSWIAYFTERSPRTIQLAYAPASDTDLRRYCGFGLTEASLSLRTFIPAAQVIALVILGFSLLFSSDAAAMKLVNGVIQGHPAGSPPNRNVGGSIRADGSKLPGGIKGENGNGALTLLWADDKTLYVTPVHHRLPHKGRTVFLDWFALNRDHLDDYKYTGQWTVSEPKAQERAPLWPYLAVGLITCAIFGWSFWRSYLEQRGQGGSIRQFQPTDIDEIAGSAAMIRAIYAAVASKRDVALRRSTGSGSTELLWIRHKRFSDGLMMETDRKADVEPIRFSTFKLVPRRPAQPGP